jgi:Tfp pilus assembly protein PilO
MGEHATKKILQKFHFMKKSKWPQKAHLWLNIFLMLAHLIVIAHMSFQFIHNKKQKKESCLYKPALCLWLVFKSTIFTPTILGWKHG